MQHARHALYLLILALIPATAIGQPAEDPPPRNVIVFISDGCGPASFTLARDYLRYKGVADRLTVDALQVGSIQTYSADSRVTDSAAAATAFACGVKTTNGAVGVDSLGHPVATILEAAEARGMATGLVVRSTITHATPAGFSAHVPNRGDEATIARQQLEQGIDVLLGGGGQFFAPTFRGGARRDSLDLLRVASGKGYQVIQNRQDLLGFVRTPLLGLFAPGQMTYEIDRDTTLEPSLAEMTARALHLLDDDPDGFFLMVEGSRIDHAGHDNDAAAHLREVLAFDDAVAIALDFARTDGRTLIVSTSDHETGGLSLGRSVDGVARYSWQPEVLDRITASHGVMASRARKEGLAPCAMMQQYAGITCTEDEAAAFAALPPNANAARLIADMINRRAELGWTTTGHTAVDVNLYAFGPGSRRFIGHHDNTAVARIIADLMQFDLEALTQTLQLEATGSR